MYYSFSIIHILNYYRLYNQQILSTAKLLSRLPLLLLYISFRPCILKNTEAKDLSNTACPRSSHLTARQSRQTLRVRVDTRQQTSPDSPIEPAHLRLLPQTLRMSLMLQNALTTAGPLTLPTSAPYLRKMLPIAQHVTVT